MDRFSLSDLRGRRAYWLLDVHAFGQILRLSTVDLLVSEASSGAEWRYTGNLPGAAFTSAVAMLQDNLDAGGLQVECVLPVDVPALLAKGHQLEGARAELSRWVEGTDYSDRRVLLVGRVQESETGADGEPCAFSVAEHVWEQTTLIPSAAQIVDVSICSRDARVMLGSSVVSSAATASAPTASNRHTTGYTPAGPLTIETGRIGCRLAVYQSHGLTRASIAASILYRFSSPATAANRP